MSRSKSPILVAFSLWVVLSVISIIHYNSEGRSEYRSMETGSERGEGVTGEGERWSEKKRWRGWVEK